MLTLWYQEQNLKDIQILGVFWGKENGLLCSRQRSDSTLWRPWTDYPETVAECCDYQRRVANIQTDVQAYLGNTVWRSRLILDDTINALPDADQPPNLARRKGDVAVTTNTIPKFFSISAFREIRKILVDVIVLMITHCLTNCAYKMVFQSHPSCIWMNKYPLLFSGGEVIRLG